MYPHLRVAYIEEVKANRQGDIHHYSVLIRYNPVSRSIEEIYRVKVCSESISLYVFEFVIMLFMLL